MTNYDRTHSPILFLPVNLLSLSLFLSFERSIVFFLQKKKKIISFCDDNDNDNDNKDGWSVGGDVNDEDDDVDDTVDDDDDTRTLTKLKN